LQRRFRKVDVIEPSVADTKLILRGLRAYYEDYHKLIYADAALDAAAELTARYVQNQYLPDKAIDVIDAAGARQRIADPAVRKTMVDVEDIELEVSELAKIPMRTVLEGEKEKLQRLSGDLSTHIFGQDKAIQTLTDAVQIARAGLREPNKPAGSYLFAGPSGVGKTEVARRLAKTLSIELIKFDMSEYMEKHSVSRLIGAPPGYVGHGEGGAGAGLLTNAIERAPHCVLLLDEIEKAHPDIFNVLLQVMDDAVLTNSQGKPIHFENVIIIMTTNAGAADMIRPAIGFGDPQRTGEDDTAIQKLFTPEFRNRLDAVVKFDSLQPEHMKLVTNKFVAELAERVAPKGVTLHLTPKAREWLAKKGYDPQMGARPLARVIEEKVKRPLARLMLFGALEKGGTATIAVANDDLVLTTP
jgi:ATP-dependent Clp protease ATP-binding subunit ClpA